MSFFKYKGKNLLVEKSSILNIIKKNKTPFYLYSLNQIKKNYLDFSKTFKKLIPLSALLQKQTVI